MHGHSGDSSGVGTYVESGSGDGRRKRRTTEVLTTEMRWHDEIKPVCWEDQLGWEKEIERKQRGDMDSDPDYIIS